VQNIIYNNSIKRVGIDVESITREQALILFKKYNQSEALLRHAYAVEGVMRHFASKFNENIDKWGVIGLLHDLDYEMYPDQHCAKSKEILEKNNYPTEYIHAIISHGYGLCYDVEPVEFMEKVLYTIDELTGLIVASALMRPSKSVSDLEAKSVKKKFKQKNFASGVNRELILKGCEMINMELSEVITQCIFGMRVISDSINL